MVEQERAKIHLRVVRVVAKVILGLFVPPSSGQLFTNSTCPKIRDGQHYLCGVQPGRPTRAHRQQRRTRAALGRGHRDERLAPAAAPSTWRQKSLTCPVSWFRHCRVEPADGLGHRPVEVVDERHDPGLETLYRAQASAAEQLPPKHTSWLN